MIRYSVGKANSNLLKNKIKSIGREKADEFNSRNSVN